MKCKDCGAKLKTDQDHCSDCGVSLFGGADEKNSSNIKKQTKTKDKKPSVVWKVVLITFLFLFFAGCIRNSLEGVSVRENNEAMESYASGDGQTAISQFQEAFDKAITNDAKVPILVNLGYAYLTEWEYNQALITFKKALEFANKDTFSYHLISAEIALLENEPEEASENYLQAYELSPTDFQINNALAIFYLDPEEKYSFLSAREQDYPRQPGR